MKKLNKNIIVFVFFITFIIAGVWGDCFEQLKGKTIDFAAGVKHGNINSVLNYKAEVDNVSNKALSYHDVMMDVNSVKENLLGTKVIIKDDTIVVKSNSGSLTEEIRKISDIDLEKIVHQIKRIKTVSELNGAKFLYCAAPCKEMYEATPENIENYSMENYNSLLFKLNSERIPTIDFSEIFAEQSEEIFYTTDHHWSALSGFAANKALCEELNRRYDFTVNSDFTNIENYQIEYYNNWFLGSRGKIVGTYFTWHGADDFALITPKFETDMSEEQPYKKEKRNGIFEDTVLFMENMKKDYYRISSYVTYSGGDFRLQIMKNNLNLNGKKVLLIRDSFACVVAPFLALQTSELHICDMRNYVYYVGEKLNAEDYIKQIEPDYVIVLYSGVTSIEKQNGKYDFF